MVPVPGYQSVFARIYDAKRQGMDAATIQAGIAAFGYESGRRNFGHLAVFQHYKTAMDLKIQGFTVEQRAVDGRGWCCLC
jgi:hypothetical protein